MTDIYEISGKQAPLFFSMDPYGIAKLSGIGGVHSFVATQSLVGGEKPVGIATVSFENNKAVILWLYVHANYRCMGIGEELIKKIYELAKGKGAVELHVKIPQLPAKGGFPIGIEYYFYERGFEKQDKVVREFLLDSDLLSKLSEGDEEDRKNVFSIDKIPGHIVAGVADSIQMRYGITPGMGKYDKESSCVCFDKKQNILAMLLFREVSETWFLAGSFARDEESAEKVLRYSLSVIAGKMILKSYVWMNEVDDTFVKATRHVLGNILSGGVQELKLDID